MNKYISRLIIYTLKNNLDARDDVYLTIQIVHDKEMQLLCYSKEEYYEAFYSGSLSSVYTIGRAWRFVQERHPELRGKEWEERQRKAGLMSREIIDEKNRQLDLFD
jgi:hypothetical protein